jgi:hypothetical protein
MSEGKKNEFSRDEKSGASPLHPDPEGGAAAGLQADRARQEEGWRADLARLDYEIETLRSVLIVKNNQAAELKRRLGITPIVEMKQDIQQGIQTIRDSDAYQKTETALKTIGDYASRKLSDVRNSTAFKSVEEKVGEAYQSVKRRSVSGFDDSVPSGAGLTVSTDSSTIVHQPAPSSPKATEAEAPLNEKPAQ